MARTRQPRTIEELLQPHRVWVTPCGCWQGARAHKPAAEGRALSPFVHSPITE